MIVSSAEMSELWEYNPFAYSMKSGTTAARAHPSPFRLVTPVQFVPKSSDFQQRPVVLTSRARR